MVLAKEPNRYQSVDLIGSLRHFRCDSVVSLFDPTIRFPRARSIQPKFREFPVQTGLKSSGTDRARSIRPKIPV